jgi:hypothetical protein
MDKFLFCSPTFAAKRLPQGFLVCTLVTSLTTLVDYCLMRLSRPRYSSKGSEAVQNWCLEGKYLEAGMEIGENPEKNGE